LDSAISDKNQDDFLNEELDVIVDHRIWDGDRQAGCPAIVFHYELPKIFRGLLPRDLSSGGGMDFKEGIV